MGEDQGAGTVVLRPVEPGDREALLAVYASTRAAELAPVPWSEADKHAFVRHQFDAQDRHYRTHRPGCRFLAVVVEGRCAGRLYVDRRADEVHVVDIALEPGVRNRGIGTGLLRDVLAEADAAGLPARLHVDAASPALRLYGRLGFRAVEEDDVTVLMERPCATSPR